MHFAVSVHRRHHQRGAGLLAHHLPGHDVGVVLQMRDQNFIARPQDRPGKALRHQVDRLGGAAHENDFVARARVDEALQAITRTLVHRRGFLAQGVNAAMNVGVVMPLVIVHRVDHALRALGGGAIVQISQRLAMDQAGQDRELRRAASTSKMRWVAARAILVHRKFRSICESGNWLISAFSMADRAEADRHAGQHIGEKGVIPAGFARFHGPDRATAGRTACRIEPAGGRTMRAFDLIGVDLELRPGVDFRVRRQQQAAAGLLRIGTVRSGIDDHLAIENDPAAVAGNGTRGLPAARVGRRMGDDVHAVHMPRLVTDEQGIALQARAAADASGPPAMNAPSRRRAQS